MSFEDIKLFDFSIDRELMHKEALIIFVEDVKKFKILKSRYF